MATPKMLCIVLETFTLKSCLFWFMLPILGWVYLLCISDRIKRLISNGYPYHVCLNKGIRVKLTTPISCVISVNRHGPKKSRFCYFLNPSIFQYSFGKRKKIRWLKVHITIRKEKPPWCAAYCYNTEETKGR